MPTFSLRDLRNDDLDLLLSIELNTENQRYTRLSEDLNAEQLAEFLHSDHNLRKYGQLRQVIDSSDGSVGFIDCYNADFESGRIGVGILIQQSKRRKGAAIDALKLISGQLRNLGFKTIYAEVENWNSASISLFKKAGYTLLDDSECIFELNLE